MVKRNLSFCEEKKKEIIAKTWILHEYKNSYYGKVLVFGLFGDGGKYGLLLIQKDDVRWYFLQHGKPRFFWVRKSSCFELFRDRKYGLFFI